MSIYVIAGLVLGVGVAGGIVLGMAAWNGWSPAARIPTGRGSRFHLSETLRRRIAVTSGIAVIVAVLTRWPVAVAAAGTLVWLWPSMFGASRIAALQIARLEALATWTESLRDTIAGSIGLEQAIIATTNAAPDEIRGPLRRLVGRLRSHLPLPQALSAFAEEFDDVSVDLVVAALILNARLRGPGLVNTLTALATSAREELDMRRGVEEGRKNLRRAATIIVTVTVTFAGGLILFSRSYLAPYGTVPGQVVLLMVVAIFAAGFMWIRAAATGKTAERFLVDAATLEHSGGGLR